MAGTTMTLEEELVVVDFCDGDDDGDGDGVSSELLLLLLPFEEDGSLVVGVLGVSPAWEDDGEVEDEREVA